MQADTTMSLLKIRRLIRFFEVKFLREKESAWSLAKESHCVLGQEICYKRWLKAKFHFLNFSWEPTGGLLKDTVSIKETLSVENT